MRTTFSSLFVAASVSFASAVEFTEDFELDAAKDNIVEGQIIDDEFNGITVSAMGGSNLAVIYDSDAVGGNDPDLEFGGGYASGNHSGTSLENLVIIEAAGTDGDGNGVIDTAPDSNPTGGMITFDLDFFAEGFRFSFVDLDSTPGTGYSVMFSDSASGLSSTVDFSEFVTLGDNFFDSSVVFGDNSANDLPLITPGSLDMANTPPASTMTQFDQIKFTLGGEGGIGDIHITPVPEPSAFLVLMAGLFLPVMRRSRGRKSRS